MSRRYSNAKVKLAGKILVSPSVYTNKEFEESQDVLTYWRTIHSTPLNTFQATLRGKVKRLNLSNVLVAQRIKRVASIESKLKRFTNMKLSTMQDIAGLRAVVKNLEQLRVLEGSYRRTLFKHELIDEKDYVEFPDNSGYRGVHLVYKYVSHNFEEANGLKIELQIRTKLQHTWATAVETMGTFLNHSLKSSQGPEDWLEYFSLVSAGFSFLENSSPPVKFSYLTKKEVYERIRNDSLKLRVEECLSGFTVATDHIYQNGINSKYHLITLNIEKRTVRVQNYTTKEFEKANIDYTNIEREVLKGAPIQAVLVSAGSLDSLRKAYPSYFLDSQEFLQKLELIYNLLQKL